ncbi:MAG: SIMPL domain-containing protein [Bacteroidales bacterium]|nr:SIMPL domain-containing protein [Bacteroidales bacterium]
MLTTYGQESGKNFIDQNFVEVTGFAEKQITPDRIYLRILVNDKDIKGKTLEETENIMISKLQEIGIDVAKCLMIKDFISNFQKYWIVKSDILMMKEYQLLVFDAKTAGEVFTELEKLGISNISIDRLDHSEIEKYRQEVKVDAIKSAKEKAIALTTAINQEAGRALYILEHVNNTNMAGELKGQVARILIRGASVKNIYGSRAPDPDIEFEKIKLEYNITVRFELK